MLAAAKRRKTAVAVVGEDKDTGTPVSLDMALADDLSEASWPVFAETITHNAEALGKPIRPFEALYGPGGKLVAQGSLFAARGERTVYTNQHLAQMGEPCMPVPAPFLSSHRVGFVVRCVGFFFSR